MLSKETRKISRGTYETEYSLRDEEPDWISREVKKLDTYFTIFLVLIVLLLGFLCWLVY